MTYEIIRKLNQHPIPFDQERINDIWDGCKDPALSDEEPPHVDTAHEDYTETIAEYGPWHVFRTKYPFRCTGVVFWHRETSEAIRVDDDEGQWHQLVNLFAEIVDQEGDCRDAEYSDSLQAHGSYKQRCKDCGDSWMVG